MHSSSFKLSTLTSVILSDQASLRCRPTMRAMLEGCRTSGDQALSRTHSENANAGPTASLPFAVRESSSTSTQSNGLSSGRTLSAPQIYSPLLPGFVLFFNVRVHDALTTQLPAAAQGVVRLRWRNARPFQLCRYTYWSYAVLERMCTWLSRARCSVPTATSSEKESDPTSTGLPSVTSGPSGCMTLCSGCVVLLSGSVMLWVREGDQGDVPQHKAELQPGAVAWPTSSGAYLALSLFGLQPDAFAGSSKQPSLHCCPWYPLGQAIAVEPALIRS
jgi:hypothetical protein